MRKLAGADWGADLSVLRRTYVGYVRPALEYGIAAWGTAARSNFQKVSKTQNQALRIMSGSLRSTPITDMESLTGLQSLEDRRDAKLLNQFFKYYYLKEHPMHNRLLRPRRGRLKRTSFIQTAKSKMTELDLHPLESNVALRTYTSYPSWVRGKFPQIIDSINGISSKSTLSNSEIKCITEREINHLYPSRSWIRIFTDGSAKDATRDGGGGIYIEWPNGEKIEQAVPTGTYSTNYRAEAEALREACTILSNLTLNKKHKVVFLTDAKSVLQALTNPKDTQFVELTEQLGMIANLVGQSALQWIPGHCGIQGNDTADRLAKNGSAMIQTNHGLSYQETRVITKSSIQKRWLDSHKSHSRQDPIHQITREGQRIIFRLRTGHNRLRYHMFKTFSVGDTDMCPCNRASETVEHVLQNCELYSAARVANWPTPTSMNTKLYGAKMDLDSTIDFIKATGLQI